MKILVISNLYPPDILGGYEISCEQAVNALIAKGHEVRVLTSTPRKLVEKQPHVIRSLTLSDLWDYYSESRRTAVANSTRDAQALQVNAFNVHALLDVIEEFQPDVAYLWMLVGIGGLGLLACLQHLQIPWVWQIGDDVPAKLCSIARRVEPALANEFARQANGTYVAVSQQIVNTIEQSGVSLCGREQIISTWIIGERPKPRESYYTGEHLKIVAASALIDRHYDKGIDLIIKAAAILKNQGYDRFSIDIFGRVTDPFYADLIKSLRIENHVAFKGSLTHAAMMRAYRNYDISVAPGRPGEPYGLAPLEALMQGCVPLVAGSTGASEWLVHGVHCVKVNRTPEAIAAMLRKIIKCEIALEPLARRGELAVWRDYHLDTILPRIESILETAAQTPRNNPGTASEAYRLAILSEKLTDLLIQEKFCA